MKLASKIVLAFVIILNLNIAQAGFEQCKTGLLPIGGALLSDKAKDEVINAFLQKGFEVVLINDVSEAKNIALLADASVNCTPTYFGTFAKTTLRIIDNSNNQIVARITTSGVMDLYNCKIELLKAIDSLPACQ